jgi:hypothetical protein
MMGMGGGRGGGKRDPAMAPKRKGGGMDGMAGGGMGDMDMDMPMDGAGAEPFPPTSPEVEVQDPAFVAAVQKAVAQVFAMMMKKGPASGGPSRGGGVGGMGGGHGGH